MTTLFLTIMVASYFGTLGSHFSIMWAIERKTRKAEQKKIEALKELQDQFIKEQNKKLERQKEYIRLES